MRSIAVLLAEALGHSDQVSEGLAVVEEAIERSERSDERGMAGELLRIKGELLLLLSAPADAVTAENQFRRALDAARRHGALSWELRAQRALPGYCAIRAVR